MSSRSKALDVLRAIAIILVMGRHMQGCPSEQSALLYAITAVWKKGGWIGVDLFFVISGFLISGLLFSEHKRFGRISFKQFFIRRGFKIYPPFYALIAAAYFYSAFHEVKIGNKVWISEILFMQDYFGAFFNHTWSLAVEEKFYLFLPLLLVYLSKVKGLGRSAFRLIPVIFVFLGLSCLFLRILASTASFCYLTNLFPFHLRIDSFFFGVTISYFYHYHSERFMKIVRRFKRIFLIVGIALLMPAFIFNLEGTAFIYTFGLTLFYIGGGLILMAIIENSFDNSSFFKVFALLGSYSYSIYLWHMPMASWGVRLAKRFLISYWSWEVYAIVYLLGSILLGIIMAKMIEFPMLRLRDKLFPSRSRSPLA